MTCLVSRVSHEQSGSYTLISGPWSSILSWLSTATEVAEGTCTAARMLCSPFPWLLACHGKVDETDTQIGLAFT